MPVSALHGGLFHLYPAADPVKYRPHWKMPLLWNPPCHCAEQSSVFHNFHLPVQMRAASALRHHESPERNHPHPPARLHMPAAVSVRQTHPWFLP